MFRQGKLEITERFLSKAEAMAYYDGRMSVCTWALVDWSVSYPRQES